HWCPVLNTDKFGKVFASIRNDIQGNIQKIYKRYNENPGKNRFLEDMLFGEKAEGGLIIKDSLEWLRRNLHFILRFLQLIIEDADVDIVEQNFSSYLRVAYSETLQSYHGWMGSHLFNITEFANLDNHDSPIKKLNCICTTLDLIYADLKYFLIKIFCINSDSELQIPIVEERDVSAILLYVIIKAKPLHIKTNIYLMENFEDTSAEYNKKREILKKFKSAVDNLFHLSKSSLRAAYEEGIKDLDLKQIISLTNNKTNYKELSTPLQLRNYEILKLVLLATNI
ncbi:uncharacterized protein LOC108739854, partial [Agrilus planipennis]|uniref:Uncharacterized protein LOC108739854 n=1 Tax=Agrilus planipennis TaxID=224129 RepID=A0A7F5RCU0_AGRPL